MSVKEYSLKFVKLSKFASYLVSSSRDEMSKFVTGVSEYLEEECRASILHENMDHARLMVHAQQVEESHQRKRGREGKNPKPLNKASSSTGKSSFGVQDRLKFKKGNQDLGNPTPSRNLMQKDTSLAPRRAMIKMPSVTESRVVSVVVYMEVSAWYVLMPAMGAGRVGI